MNPVGSLPMSDTSKPSAEVRLRVEELAGFHGGLVRAVVGCGLVGAELTEFFNGKVRATCVGCGLVVGGEELGRLALVPGAGGDPDPQSDRLRLGYCGRPNCQSRFYQVVVDSVPKVEAPTVVPRALELWRNPPPETESPDVPKALVPWWKQRRNQYALGALALVLVVWWKLGPTEGPLAIRKEPTKYQAAPEPYRGGSGEALQ
jgi:hypothetical protein